MHKIEFFYEIDFDLEHELRYRSWIEAVIVSEDRTPGDISYVFCEDDYMLNLHQKYLRKDSLTDIITFDYSEGKIISGDIFVSIPRVKDNAIAFGCGFEEELMRVMSHGILHLSGYNDKTEKEKELMRKKENEKIQMFHVEH